MSDLIRREDALQAIHDALVVNPARDEARKLAGFVVRALPAVQPDARIEALTAERDRLRLYAGHDDDCTINRYPSAGACSCGLRAAHD